MPAKATAKTTKQTTSTIKTRKRNNSSYGSYIQKVLKNVHPDIAITKESMTVMDNILKDVYEKIVEQATKFMKVDKRQTLTEKDIQSSIKLVFHNNDLAAHAVTQADIAINKFNGVASRKN
jgi:histone H2B